MADRTVAIVDSSDISLLERFIGEDLIEAGISVNFFEHAIPAIETFSKMEFGYILTSLDVAPGGGLDKHEKLKEIFYSHRYPIGRPDYSEVALYTIKAARKSPLNERTPILVASVSEPNGDRMYPFAEKRSLEAGANL